MILLPFLLLLLVSTIRIVRIQRWSTKRKIWHLAILYILLILMATGALFYKWHLEEKENDANPMIQELKKDFPNN